MGNTEGNLQWVERARRHIPGGVNSNNRALPWPMAIVRAEGAYFYDADGNRYLDYHAAFGPIILGHNHPAVNAAVREAMERVDLVGTAVTDLEVLLAEKISEHVPSAEMVALCNSGSEATYLAIRLARAVTGRPSIVKFQGTYHGWHDAVAMNVISPPERIGRKDPLSQGMLQEEIDHTFVLPFNNLEAVGELMDSRSDEIAAVIVEVIPHNIGCVMPKEGFLEGLRTITHANGSLLIFDEVVTGFRHDLGGYQRICGVTPDLSTFAKAMANGYPIAALVGKAEYMERLAPGGGVFFAGTFNGTPSSVAAALATIRELEVGGVHEHCFQLAEMAANGLQEIASELGIVMTVARFGSVFVPYFMEGPIESYEDLLRNDTERDIWFRRSMCEHGVFMLPTALKRNHVGAAHTEADIAMTLEIARQVLSSMPAHVS
ncbi:aminotransferase class-III [Thermobaculum terrenum ATCC BAA-798]|uniref:glutamate-1-semialdehyde 2,1-aminomutase n=1 Tax=Thermobaculum terrenum (strain ATCC BAA-798 / CCMEE 7001 / YNP1) TaxID=525904 RepID=D1CGK0_THET1|nr:aspartate aminotransferase family protein [Thermobaculum terrenum]ACZ42871.1 aminotransferase class-III [Thermobaculum terrenum ATCC BAA-798]